jgi:hypothetical protein
VVRRRDPSYWHGVGMGISIRTWLASAAVCVLAAAAGCGSGSRHAAGTTQVTVPAYGVFPATTVRTANGRASDGRSCRATALSFADDSADLLAHFGSKAAYPADLNYVIVRSELAAFRSGHCDLQLLGRALERRLSPKQRTDLVADLPRSMGAVVSGALAHASSSS